MPFRNQQCPSAYLLLSEAENVCMLKSISNMQMSVPMKRKLKHQKHQADKPKIKLTQRYSDHTVQQYAFYIQLTS